MNYQPFQYMPGFPAYPIGYPQQAQLQDPPMPRQANIPSTMPVQSQQSNNGILWVQGEEGAKAYMVAPGSSVLLMDSENSSFYIKQSDNSGMPLPLRIFDYVERDVRSVLPTVTATQDATPVADYVTRKEFDEFAEQVAAMVNAAKSSDVKASDSTKREEYTYEQSRV